MLPRVNELENEEVCAGLRILNLPLLLGVWLLKSAPGDLSLHCYRSWGQQRTCSVITVSPEQGAGNFFRKQWEEKTRVRYPRPFSFHKKGREKEKKGRKKDGNKEGKKGGRKEGRKKQRKNLSLKTPNISSFPSPINDPIKLSQENNWHWRLRISLGPLMVLLHKVLCAAWYRWLIWLKAFPILQMGRPRPNWHSEWGTTLGIEQFLDLCSFYLPHCCVLTPMPIL